MERLSVRERERIAELLAEGAPFWRLRQEIHRSRHAIKRAIRSIQRPPPGEPRRSRLHVTPTEREEISRGIAAGESLRAIRGGWGGRRRRSREKSAQWWPPLLSGLPRGSGRVGPDASTKVAKLAGCPRLRAVVEAKLEAALVPGQIAGWLSVEYPDDPEMRVSHETIYLSLFVQTRRAPQGTDALSPSSAQQSPSGRQAVTQRPKSHPGDGQHS